MGKFSWLRRVGKVAGEVGIAVAPVAVEVATKGTPAGAAISAAVQVTTAIINSEQPVTEDTVKTLNQILLPHGFMVVKVPDGVNHP